MKAQFQSAAEAPADVFPASPASLSLAPVLAGARARGMADALELLGVAAILIDECGFAMHVNDRAKCLLGPEPPLKDGRLRAAARELDAALGAALDSALTAGAPARAAVNAPNAVGSQGVLAVKALPVAAGAADPFQLVRAIVIIEERPAPAAETLN